MNEKQSKALVLLTVGLAILTIGMMGEALPDPFRGLVFGVAIGIELMALAMLRKQTG